MTRRIPMKPSGLKRERIMFITPSLSSFAANDIEILSKKYEVTVNVFNWKKKFLLPLFMIRQGLIIITRAGSLRAIVISTGGYWSVVPVLMGSVMSIPVFIILNGTDCASIPEIPYGSLRKPILRAACKVSYARARLLLPVSESLISIRNTFALDPESQYQGYKHFFPEIRTPVKVIHNGIDSSFWTPLPGMSREDHSFISVFSKAQFILKGGDLILEMARRFPECRFYIAGMEEPPQGFKAPSNVIFKGIVKPAELKRLYSGCTFHLQLSLFEGFGYALCEAMLCGCIPIGSNVNMIPDIIGDTGFILERKDPAMLEIILRELLEMSNERRRFLSDLARQRIIANFEFSSRERELLQVVEEDFSTR